MKNAKKGFVIPIVLVFMVISHLVYAGLLHITQMQIRHVTLLQEHYQRNIQNIIAKELINKRFAEELPALPLQIIADLRAEREQLLYGISLDEPLFVGDNDQYGAYYTSGDIERIYIYCLSILTEQSPLFDELETPFTISFVNDADYLANHFQDKLLSRTDPQMVSLFEQLEALNWQEVNYSEGARNLQWQMPDLNIQPLAFNSGQVTMEKSRGYLMTYSQLDGKSQKHRMMIPLPTVKYRLFSQFWTFELAEKEEINVPNDTLPDMAHDGLFEEELVINDDNDEHYPRVETEDAILADDAQIGEDASGDNTQTSQ